MIKAVIFDLDGTLLDTSRDIQKVLNHALGKFSLPPISLKQTISFVGDGAKKLIERAVGERRDLYEKVYAEYMEKFVKCDNSMSRLYDREDETLNKLIKRGIRLAIISNKPQAAVDRVYSDFLAKFGFCIVLGQTEYYPLKPNPSSTLAVMDKLGVTSEECLYVGDGDADVIVAKAAGIRCISALWGFRTRAELEKSGAREFAENFSELEKFVIE